MHGRRQPPVRLAPLASAAGHNQTTVHGLHSPNWVAGTSAPPRRRRLRVRSAPTRNEQDVRLAQARAPVLLSPRIHCALLPQSEDDTAAGAAGRAGLGEPDAPAASAGTGRPDETRADAARTKTSSCSTMSAAVGAMRGSCCNSSPPGMWLSSALLCILSYPTLKL